MMGSEDSFYLQAWGASMRTDNNGDPEWCRAHEWSEGVYSFTSNPQRLHKIPDPRSIEGQVEARLYVDRSLPTIFDIVLRVGEGLSDEGRAVRENPVIKAWQMSVQQGKKVEAIAQELNCDDSTVYRYLAMVELMGEHFGEICPKVKGRLEEAHEWKSLQVLHYIQIGKQKEQMICLSAQVSFAYQCTDPHQLLELSKKVPGAKIKGEPPYIQWKYTLARDDVEDAYVNIRRLSLDILKERKLRKKAEN
jgi:hypothetical protein